MALEEGLGSALGVAPAAPTATATRMSALDKAMAHGAGVLGTAFDEAVSEEGPKVPPVEPEVTVVPKESAPDGFFYLSDMTDGRLPRSGKDHLFPRYPEDHWKPEFRHDIPEVDPFYFWDADVAEGLWLAYVMNEKCMLHGFPGTGKTTAVHQLAAWVRQPYAKFGGKGGIEPASFLGQLQAIARIQELKDGTEVMAQEMVWKDGLMPPAVREGYLTTIDEFCKIGPDVQMAMQSLYEKGGHLMLDDKPGTISEKRIDPHPEFRMMVTDNTLGLGDNLHLFASSEMQDTSTLDRFTVVIPVDYMQKSEECALLSRKYPKVNGSDVFKIVTFANMVRESYKVTDLPVTLSQRGLSAMCDIMERGLSLETAVQFTFINKLAEDTHKNLAKEQLLSA